MGMFFEEKPINDLLPELENWLKTTFNAEYADTKVVFQESCGLANEGIFVRFYCGKERTSPYQYSGYFSLTSYPGNCGIVISHNLWILPVLQGKGLGNFLQDFKKRIALAYGFTMMKCTTRSNNDVENHLLEKYGWKRTLEFKNNRTNNPCIEWTLDISKKKGE